MPCSPKGRLSFICVCTQTSFCISERSDQGESILSFDLFNSPGTQEDLAARLRSIEETLRKIGDVISEITRFSEIQRDHERRLAELEATLNRMSGIVMDLKQPGTLQSPRMERMDTLEAAVQRISAAAAEQKSLLEAQLAQQSRMLEEMRRELAKRGAEDEESLIHEIDEIFRRRRK